MTHSSNSSGGGDGEQERLQRLATLGTLAATSANEVSQLAAQLLASLRAAAEAIDALDGERDADELRGELDAALDASTDCGERLRDLARRMVSCAGSPTDELELLDAADLADDAIATVLPTLRKYAVLQREYESAVPRVRADRGKLCQTLINLLLNAIQACQRTPDYTNHCISVEVRLASQWVCIDVSDTGPGIDDDIVDHIFDPFFTTRRADGAVGLGLTVARATLDQLGGQLLATSRRGKGATFTILLPAS